MTEEKMTKLIKSYWQILFTVLVVVFNVGYTVNELQHKPDVKDVKAIVKEEIENNIKNRYVKIEDGSSIETRLKNIEQSLQEQKVMTQKIIDRLLDER